MFCIEFNGGRRWWGSEKLKITLTTGMLSNVSQINTQKRDSLRVYL